MSHISLYYHPATVADWCDVDRWVTIDMLPDVALLSIFDCYVEKKKKEPLKIQEWDTLVHVCRQWRTIVLGSPRRLDLRPFCPVKETSSS